MDMGKPSTERQPLTARELAKQLGFAYHKHHPVPYAAHAAGSTHAVTGYGPDLAPGWPGMASE